MVHITTRADWLGPSSPFTPILPVPVDVPTGWECPRCRRVWSPQTDECAPCSPGRPRELRESYTFSGFPVAPREPGPMCKCSPVPAAGPRASFPRPENPRLNEAWIDDDGILRCWDGEEWAVYTDMPEVQACAPSREGGMCGCGEPDEKPAPDCARVLLRLPDEMNSPHYQRIARIGREWIEVLPGLQACVPGPDLALGGWAVTALFRLTPAGGESGG